MPLLFLIDFSINDGIKCIMSKNYESRIAVLQLQLEEALQMLRLVADNKRTCLEVEEWLKLNFPDFSNEDSTLTDLLKMNKTKK
jgi:hypothetical protein